MTEPNYAADPIETLIEATIRGLLSDLSNASDPQDKEKLAAAVKHLQHAKSDGLTGGSSSDPLDQAVLRILEESKTNQQTKQNGTETQR